MRVLIVAMTLALSLGAAPLHAQTPPAGKPKPPAADPQPPRPFPEGARVAYVSIQQIASESAEGKAATAKVNALVTQIQQKLADRNKQLQALQEKLQQGLTVMSDQARAQLEKEIERTQVDIQRATQDAQADVQELQRDLQVEFQTKLMPVIQQVSSERGLHMVFSADDAGLVWADGGLDLTPEVIKRFDAGAGKPSAASTQTPQTPSSR
jgi:outer membrane protein